MTAQDQLDVELRGANLEIVDWEDVQRIFRDYSEGVAPPIPTISLDVDSGLTAIDERKDNRCAQVAENRKASLLPLDWLSKLPTRMPTAGLLVRCIHNMG